MKYLKKFNEGSLANSLRKLREMDLSRNAPLYVPDKIAQLCKITGSGKYEDKFFLVRFYKKSLREDCKLKLEGYGFFELLNDKVSKLREEYLVQKSEKGTIIAISELKQLIDKYSSLLIIDNEKMKAYINKKRRKDPYGRHKELGNMHNTLLLVAKEKGI